MTSRENPLVGRTLVGVKLAKDRQAIKFLLSEGEPVIAKCDADCCSYTWVENIELPSLPAMVRSVEDIEMPETTPPQGVNGPEHPEEVAFYGCRITTSTGHLIIDYRNDSNGYYGGDLKWPGEYYYGGVYGQNVSNNDWEDVI